MENYIVSARKYRPMTFDSVVGQSALTQTLMKSIQTGHLAHAYLFCGPRGVGKTTCARIFAKTINCLSPLPSGEACGECESCKAFAEQRSFNIYELDAASNNGVEEIKNLIEQTRIPPQVGRYKVFIIDEVHMLSNAAFNAFLKTLEEPPQYVIFILATTEKHKLLPTILSRCQIYDFNRMSVADIVAHLRHVAEQEGITVEPQALTVIAEKADGGMRDALSIFDQVAAFCGGNITYKQTIENLNVLDAEYYFRVVDFLLDRKIPDVLATFNDIVNRGFEASHFVAGLNSHLRGLLMCRDEKTVKLLDTDEQVRQRYYQQSKRCKPQFLYAAIRRLTDCDINYKMSQNKRLLVEITLIEIAQLADDDAPSSGRGPKKILKPIFSTLAAKQMVAAASVPAGRHTHQQPAQPSQAQPRPVMNVASVSISDMKGQMDRKAVADTKPAEEPVACIGNGQLDLRTLIIAIKQFAERLPADKVAMKMRLNQLDPCITGEKSAEIVAENPAVAEQYRQLMPSLCSYIAKVVGIDSIRLDIVIPEANSTRLLTKSQLYGKLKEKYPVLLNLEQELKLHL